MTLTAERRAEIEWLMTPRMMDTYDESQPPPNPPGSSVRMAAPIMGRDADIIRELLVEIDQQQTWLDATQRVLDRLDAGYAIRHAILVELGLPVPDLV
jgi:hypothetical protein